MFGFTGGVDLSKVRGLIVVRGEKKKKKPTMDDDEMKKQSKVIQLVLLK